MKYIFILGLNYRDCMAKLAEIEQMEGCRYTFATKPKHVTGLVSFGVIETDNAKQNPFYREVKKLITGNKRYPDYSKIFKLALRKLKRFLTVQ